MLAALAAILLLAACQRRISRRPTSGQVIRAVNGLAVGGLAAAGLAVSAAVRLAARWAGTAMAADLAGAGIAAMFAVIWFVLPALLGREEPPGRYPSVGDPPDSKRAAGLACAVPSASFTVAVRRPVTRHRSGLLAVPSELILCWARDGDDGGAQPGPVFSDLERVGGLVARSGWRA